MLRGIVLEVHSIETLSGRVPGGMENSLEVRPDG
jgi:hypothetical protein